MLAEPKRPLNTKPAKNLKRGCVRVNPTRVDKPADTILPGRNVSNELGTEPPTSAPHEVPAQVTQDQFATFNQHRSLLFGVAYRMLGSVADAEDMLQETFIRWQHLSPDGIQSPKAMLITITTRLCINYLQSARAMREEYFGEWLPEPILTAPRDNPALSLEIDESVSLAFLLLLERLSPVERAALLLRDVFDYAYSELASILDQSEANCRQILRRAHLHIQAATKRFDASREQRAELLRRFSEASFKGDMEGLVALLAKDAVFYSDGGGKAPALPKPIYGAATIARGVLEGLRRLVPRNLIRRHLDVNGKPGIVSYLDGRPFSVFSIEVSENRISQIFVVTNPEKLKHLPQLKDLAS